jgi:hypothetical protein
MKKVLIQKQLLIDLEVAISEHSKLKVDVAVFFLSLFTSIPTFYREEEQVDEISLDSQRLKKYHSKYNLYLDFCKNSEFIVKTGSYGADIKKCNVFVLSEQYLLDELISYEIKDKPLLKKFDNKGRDGKENEKRMFCGRKRPHLVKFFDDKLTIKEREAKDEIKHLIIHEKDKRKYSTRKVMITEFHDQQWKYSMKIKSDNRLHSNLTRSPKALRKHIRYDGKHIYGVDLKTSQPFFLCVLIKAILKKDKGLLEQIKATHVLCDKTIEELFNLDLNRKELIEFVQSVLKKDFYNEFEKKLSIDYDDSELPYRMVSNFPRKGKCSRKRKYDAEKGPTRKVSFKTSRDLVKEVVMEIFYSKPNTRIKEAKVFREAYPSVSKIFKCLDECKVKFSYLLQYVEAYVLLDYSAKKIHEEYPEMPLFSIHDALVTNESWIEILQEEMKKHITAISSINPKLEIEDWINS